MYTITMLDNKQLISSVKTVNYQGENNAEQILFLIPVSHNGHSLSDASVQLHIIDTSNLEDVIELEFEKDYEKKPGLNSMIISS